MIFLFGLAGMFGYPFPRRYDTRLTEFFNMMCIVGLAMILSLQAFVFGQNRRRALATIHDQKVALEHAFAEIEHLAFHDALTQLPNRRLFFDRLARALAESRRHGRHGALMFIDLDRFKPLNDAHGHEAGDQLLIEMARRIAACTREVDTVARLGGDEFAVILDPLEADRAASEARALVVAEKIAGALAEPYVLTLQRRGGEASRVRHQCTASIGIVLFLDQDSTPAELLDRADAAMYEAKSAGGHAIRVQAARD